MGKREKLLNKVLAGKSDAGTSFDFLQIESELYIGVTGGSGSEPEAPGVQVRGGKNEEPILDRKPQHDPNISHPKEGTPD